MSALPCIQTLLANGAPDAPAIGAPGRPWLTYGDLRPLLEKTVAGLNRLGIGRGDRVAVVLPNGPAMATVFLAVASAASAAPLNPSYRSDEFAFYLGDLGAKALVVAAGSDSEAIAAASAIGIPVLRITEPSGAPAGDFVIDDATRVGPPCSTGWTQDTDEALVLHTSGTTSRPKIVPLTQANVGSSALAIAATLDLKPRDRGLNIMPLFHIHGLIAGILAPLSAGSSIFCTPGFNALRFFGWMEEAKPTWYTAVPTMHQAILSRASKSHDIIANCPLRFIRSSSSSIPPQVIAELESVFGAPLIEAYGMTEAAHQMTSNPLPPRIRKPGSVGIAAGPEVAVMNDRGELLGAGETGEVVIRGPNVTAGYENNPEANRTAFTGGWFRTGDQGVIDEEGYLCLTGRLKEIINRGGEKISPREVDEVLMDHPAVEQVVTFAVPHDKLGEDVAAAFVLREGARASESELRAFASTRLAAFKVPRTIVLLEEIPKGATGKLQRIGLAEKLGLVPAVSP